MRYFSEFRWHLRIELRVLPSGPTALDASANAAFLIGLTLGLRDTIDSMLPGFPFEHAHDGFYRAAERGFDALLTWPSGTHGPALTRVPAPELALRMLPIAREGLLRSGVDEAEVARMFEVIAERIAARRSGATWQRAMLSLLEPDTGRGAALAALTQRYMELSRVGEPVHTWEVE